MSDLHRLRPSKVPQMWCLGGYLLLHATALIAAGERGLALIFVGELVVLVELSRRRVATGSRGWLIAECVVYVVFINLDFMVMARTGPIVPGRKLDVELLALERVWLGETPSFVVRPHLTAAWAELWSVLYVGFFAVLLLGLLRYLWRDRHLLEPYYRGFLVLNAIGHTGYLLVPAAGPYLAFPDQFPTPLPGGPVAAFNAALVAGGTSGLDAFPSMHCGISAYFLLFHRRHHHAAARWWAAPIAGIWISTIALGYHYLVDCVVGLLGAAVAARVARPCAAPVPSTSRAIA